MELLQLLAKVTFSNAGIFMRRNTLIRYMYSIKRDLNSAILGHLN